MNTNTYVYPLQPKEMIHYEKTGAYAYKSSGRLKHVQKVLFWVLGKLDCSYVQAHRTIKTTELDFDDIAGLVYKNRGLLEQYYHKNIKYLIVGGDWQRRIMDSDPIHFTMQFPSTFETPTRPDRFMFANLQVVMVPYMNGIALLEELPS